MAHTEMVRPRETAADRTGAGAARLYTARLTSVAMAVAIVGTLGVATYVYAGAPLGLCVLLASAAAGLGWSYTSLRRPASSPVAFNVLVATIVALEAFCAEQWVTGFPGALVALFPDAYPPGVGLSAHGFIAVFALAGAGCLVLGGLAYYHRLPFGDYAAWFTFSWAATSALAVYLEPLLSGRGLHYLGGMATAPLALIMGVLGIRRLLRAERLPAPEQGSPQ